MHTRKLIAAVAILLPVAASAADNAARCMALGKELSGTTTVIGSTQTINSHAMALNEIAAATRSARAEMQRLRCGSSSIVVLGQNDPCRNLSQQLADAERDRQAVLASRSAQRKLVKSLGRDPETLRKEMLQLRCGEIDYATVPASINPAGSGTTSPSTLRIDKQNGSSSVINLGKMRAAAPKDTSPVPAIREWKPDSTVRTVGPQFYPDGQDMDASLPGIQQSVQ